MLLERNGQIVQVPDQILIGEKMTEYKKAWSIGELDKEGKYVQRKDIVELTDGRFVYRDGSPINKKDIKELPPGDRERAAAWLEGLKVPKSEEGAGEDGSSSLS